MQNWFSSLDFSIQLYLSLILGIVIGILIMNFLLIVKNKKIGAYKRQLEKESKCYKTYTRWKKMVISLSFLRKKLSS